ncbi:bifunctional 4-hydroxy-2-oxoglutarate aldolase/2-dehydro-3-deoxy-phosphogluconate aldolase [Sphingobacteriaceae bacterium WQ 2009]|uniref:Bifunctional 4-hydroxy-2-oxoglutarate aldolase/2-dehydro-3-deoxy-phosphogluconate aldolase n=1 Tax=Rhinopithecimicrobium faecis TaxID=2820698 RepID=A0A8T4HIX1_9SPHI|nr:bifunctional 4-hydroxy-2-oxoglutarate aldolase/2-dehydro-3-deoxy-phosphogluconate aldolase [Sphingobacteriaceae bacterium WQ 2009]
MIDDKKLKNSLALIEQYPIIPVFYHDDLAVCENTLRQAYTGGIRVFEFVNRGANALQNFEGLLAYKNKHFPTMLLGIGTIKTQKQANDFIRLGADFIVSPLIKEEIAEVTLAQGILWIPGCMTPTEIALAEDLGAPLVKLFPGDLLGPKFLTAIKPLFPKLKFMPTGGVTPEAANLKAWFDAGVTAVGLGSKLFDLPADSSNENWLSLRIKRIFDEIKIESRKK